MFVNTRGRNPGKNTGPPFVIYAYATISLPGRHAIATPAPTSPVSTQRTHLVPKVASGPCRAHHARATK